MLFNNTNMRTAMAYTNAVGDKVYPIIVDIKKGIKSTEEVSFVSSDINTGVLSVAFIQGNDTYNVEGAEVICSIMRPDTTTLEIPCNTVNGNTIEVPLGVNGTSQDGVYSFDFKVFKGGNKIVGTPIMNYSVSLSISNDLVVEEDDRLPVLTMLMTQLTELKEETRETINQANVATEASREATANAIEATNNTNAVSERVSQETATAISEIKQDTANAIASMEQNTSTAISTMNQSTTDAIDSMNQNTTNAIASMTQKTDESLANMNQSTTDAIASMTQKTDDAIASMNQTTSNAISNMTQKTDEAVTRINDNLANVNNVVTTKVAELDNAKSDMTTTVANKVDEVETRFNRLTSSQQQSSEVIDARDGETSLKARLDRDIEKAKQVYVNVKGSHISTDSSDGYAKDVEILGNTIQDASNLADIRSVGDKLEGQELYEIIFESVKADGNLIPLECKVGELFNVYLPKGEYTTSCKSSSCTIRFYRKDKSLIDYWTLSGGETIYRTFTTPEDIYYVLFDGDENTTDIQVIKGNTLKPYAPYQSDKLTILSPVQLEKVGNVADRIICKDGVLGVEKNVETIVLNGSEEWKLSNLLSSETHIWFYVSMPSMTPRKDVICDNFIYTSDRTPKDVEYIHTDEDINILIDRIKLETQDVQGFKKWLQTNHTTVKYQLAQSKFIPLPHDQQIKLRTFANKTNISFLTEIEGTIKAQVPKSLGATVNTHTEQIRSLNNELNRVKKLEESTVSTVTTESDFTTVEATSNGGYFEDVKLEGKTLVNLIPTSFSFNTYNNMAFTSDILTNLNPASIYTLIVIDNNLNKLLDKAYLSDTTGVVNGLISLHKCAEGGTGHPHVYTKDGSLIPDGYMDNVKAILLEGDHTQNPPSYFEGLKSVGQSATTSEDGVDEIVVSSVNENLLFFEENYSSTNKGITYTFDAKTQVITVNGTSEIDNNTCYMYDALPKQLYNGAYSCTVEKLTDFSSPIIIRTYNKDYSNGVVLDIQNSLTATVKKPYVNDAIAFSLRVDKGATFNNAKFKVSFYKGDIKEKYTPHQSDKKRLLYYNNETQAWEKPILREWDSIEKHSDGKYYYHQRSGEVVLNGSESWGLINTGVNTTLFLCRSNILAPTGDTTVRTISDRIPGNSFANRTTDIEMIYTHNNEFAIRILNTKLSTQDAQGFKQWLQANNVTVVYQLAQEKVYECTNIDLITYTNETNYIVESGAIAPKSILKVHNNISNVVKILQEKVSLLENKFIEGLKQVLAGDMYSLAELLYPEDFKEVETENNIMLLPLE